VEFESRVSEVLSDFARTLLTDFSIQAILDHLVLRMVDVLPVTSVGVTLSAPGIHPRFIAASNAAAFRFEQLQCELGEGPCVLAFQTGEPVAVADLREDDRFPRFSERALAEGLAGVFAFPLRDRDRQIGALDLYRATPGQLDARAQSTAQTMADVAAAYVLNSQARTDLRAASALARASALHDALTGLPNRTLLVERLEHSILRCRRSKKVAAVLFADLDRFKAVNDTYGHHIGDELLQAVAERLTALLRPGDTLARLAGDEFVILCEDLDNPSQVEPIAARIDLALSVPFVVSGIEVRMSASVGIAFAGQGGDGSETVLQDADVAMYQAKHQGGARHGVVDLRKRHLANHRARLNRDLQGALGRGELRTAYQPIVSTPDERILGAEALLRWHHPAVGMVAPQTAVPLAEMSGLITEIGRWVLERACLDRQTWPRQSDEPLAVAVNVSASQLMGAEFVGSVAKVLADSGTDPGVVMLEITEGLLIQDSDRALVVLSELKRLGVTLALDDFGTGYSSLDHLQRFPVDIVKIDQAFISQVDLDRTSSLIVTAMVTRAHELGMRVVAEGVESADQRERVVSLDCDAYQGFHFARPMPTGELGPMMAASQL